VVFLDGQGTGGAASAMDITTPTESIVSGVLQINQRVRANQTLMALVQVCAGLVTGTVPGAMLTALVPVWSVLNAMNLSL